MCCYLPVCEKRFLVSFAASRPESRTQSGSHSTNQEGPWLPIGWKSNKPRWSKSKVRAKFIENTDRVFGKLRKEKAQGFHLCLRSGVFTEVSGLVCVSSQASRNWSNKDKCSSVLHKSFIPWSQGSWLQGIWSWWSWKMFMTTFYCHGTCYFCAGRFQGNQ